MKCLVPIALLLAVPVPAMAAASGSSLSLTPFTATYDVTRGGSPLGVSTVTLRQNDDGTYTFKSTLKAESGMAALLGGKVAESSRFRLHHHRIELLDYRYRLTSRVKSKSRDVTVDWGDPKVSVTVGKHHWQYAPEANLVDRHLLALALGQAVAQGRAIGTVPVAVKDRVQLQTYAVSGRTSLQVPAGQVSAIGIKRTHDDKGYAIWFAPAEYGLAPVKLAQDAGGDITLVLKSYQVTPES